MISPFLGLFFLDKQEDNFLFLERFFYGFFLLVGPGIPRLALASSLLVNCLLSLLMLVAG